MKKILVPVDFSIHSEYALEIAAQIAQRTASDIMVLHMLGLSEAVFTKDESQEYEEAMYYMSLAKKRFKTFLNKPYLKDIKITQLVQNYKIFSELNAIAKEQQIDLIVMGSHGTSGLSEVFVGSNTEKVVRTSEIPVLIVREAIPNFNIGNIVFACNFKEENILALKRAISFAKNFEAQLQLLYINIPTKFLSTRDLQQRVSNFMKQAGIQMKVEIYNDYSVEEGIYNYTDKQHADVIAIPTHGRKGLAHFFLGSLGEDLANHSNIPVLTLKLQ